MPKSTSLEPRNCLRYDFSDVIEQVFEPSGTHHIIIRASDLNPASGPLGWDEISKKLTSTKQYEDQNYNFCDGNEGHNPFDFETTKSFQKRVLERVKCLVHVMNQSYALQELTWNLISHNLNRMNSNVEADVAQLLHFRIPRSSLPAPQYRNRLRRRLNWRTGPLRKTISELPAYSTTGWWSLIEKSIFATLPLVQLGHSLKANTRKEGTEDPWGTPQRLNK